MSKPPTLPFLIGLAAHMIHAEPSRSKIIPMPTTRQRDKELIFGIAGALALAITIFLLAA